MKLEHGYGEEARKVVMGPKISHPIAAAEKTRQNGKETEVHVSACKKGVMNWRNAQNPTRRLGSSTGLLSQFLQWLYAASVDSARHDCSVSA